MSINALDLIEKIGLLPNVNVTNPDIAVRVAQALKDCGIDVVEIPLFEEASMNSLAAVRKANPDSLVGAGTVHTAELAAKVVDLGVDFVVAPGMCRETIQYCLDKGVAVIPGATTATEIEIARSMGLNILKFFPSELNGGVKMINALRAPFSDVRFITTGGVNFDNLKDYAACKGVVAAGGSFMTPARLINAERWDDISELAQRAIEISLGFEMGHVGLNCHSVGEANATAEEFAKIFGFKTREIDISFFGGNAVEAMKKPSFGANGHIAIACNSMKRAIYDLERRGYKFRFFKNNDKGEMIAAYIENEIGGFAIHLCVKY